MLYLYVNRQNLCNAFMSFYSSFWCAVAQNIEFILFHGQKCLKFENLMFLVAMGIFKKSSEENFLFTY